MGLDMYACSTDEMPISEIDFECESYDIFFAWRKHPGLHGWMEDLYRLKSGTGEFNAVSLLLTKLDLLHLEKAIENETLPAAAGCFFGSPKTNEKDRDLAFVEEAWDLLSHGRTVFYCSSW